MGLTYFIFFPTWLGLILYGKCRKIYRSSHGFFGIVLDWDEPMRGHRVTSHFFVGEELTRLKLWRFLGVLLLRGSKTSNLDLFLWIGWDFFLDSLVDSLSNYGNFLFQCFQWIGIPWDRNHQFCTSMLFDNMFGSLFSGFRNLLSKFKHTVPAESRYVDVWNK